MTYFITGGGSGGHIYPALAVADEIKERQPEAKIILVGSRRGLEKNIFNKTDYKSYFLPVGQLHSSVGRLKQIWSLIKMPYCFLVSLFLLLRYRPKFVFGVGGYASGPLGVMSSLMGVKTYIWEGNATPGITNRLLGRFNTTPFLVFPEAAKYFKKSKAIITGVPIRKSLEAPQLKSDQSSDKFSVLFVGGSQGAKVFNDVVPELIKDQDPNLDGVHIIHQTGLKNYEAVKAVYPSSQKVVSFEVLAYLDPIRDYYLAADLIVTRAGAGAVNEISMLGKPSLLVPFPKASDDHQRQNAVSMVSKGAAKMLEEKDFNLETLKKEILSLKKNPDMLHSLGLSAGQVLPKGAREKIADHLLSN